MRTHNLLTSGDGTPALKWGSTGVYTEDDQGRPRYDWAIVDRIFDTYMERGLSPTFRSASCQRAFRSIPEPYQHRLVAAVAGDRCRPGGLIRPKDYRKWAELVFQWVTHSCRAIWQEPRSSAGTGRSGTSPTSFTGGGRLKSTTGSTIMPQTP